MPRLLYSPSGVARTLRKRCSWSRAVGQSEVELWISRVIDRGGLAIGEYDYQVGVFLPVKAPFVDLRAAMEVMDRRAPYVYLYTMVSSAGFVKKEEYRKLLKREFPNACHLYFRREKYDEQRELRF